jgi:hypothetical protein
MQTTQYVSFEESYTEYGEDISLRMDGETFEINLN